MIKSYHMRRVGQDEKEKQGHLEQEELLPCAAEHDGANRGNGVKMDRESTMTKAEEGIGYDQNAKKGRLGVEKNLRLCEHAKHK